MDIPVEIAEQDIDTRAELAAEIMGVIAQELGQQPYTLSRAEKALREACLRYLQKTGFVAMTADVPNKRGENVTVKGNNPKDLGVAMASHPAVGPEHVGSARWVVLPTVEEATRVLTAFNDRKTDLKSLGKARVAYSNAQEKLRQRQVRLTQAEKDLKALRTQLIPKAIEGRTKAIERYRQEVEILKEQVTQKAQELRSLGEDP